MVLSCTRGGWILGKTFQKECGLKDAILDPGTVANFSILNSMAEVWKNMTYRYSHSPIFDEFEMLGLDKF